MDNYNDKLREWSNKVVNYCHTMATNPEYNLDLSFFAFQSLPKESPELLILGINPGREFTYADQFNNPIWGLTVEKKMTAEVFEKANPMFHNHDSWTLWKNLSKSFESDTMKDILSNSMYMNFIYFNTVKVENLLAKKGGKEVYDMCRNFSLELISEIIKPKQILCLGTGGCFDILPIKDKENLLVDKKRLLLRGKLSNIPIYGIPHPSGSITSDADRKRIGELLRKDFC
jgi:hypothetical protein